MYNSDAFDGDVDIPIYGLTPEAIFKGKVPIFDVNFFDPNQETIDYSWTTDYIPPTDGWEEYASGTSIEDKDEVNKINEQLKKKNPNLSIAQIQAAKMVDKERNTKNVKGGVEEETQYYVITRNESSIKGTYKIVLKYNILVKVNSVTILYNPSTSTSYAQDSSSEGIHSLSYDLQNTVANWYYKILIVAIVGMMSVLVYMGIRILLSSTASDKAKYKQMLGDWVIGMVILFMMHYGMVFANKMADKLTDMLDSVNPHFYVQAIEDPDGKIEEAMR